MSCVIRRCFGSRKSFGLRRCPAFLCSLSMVSSLVFFQLMSTMPLYLNEQWGFSEARIGLLFGVNTVTIILI